MGDGHAGEVVVQAAIGAAFVVIKAEALLELAVVMLDAPAQLGGLDECRDRRVGREVGEPVFDGLVLALEDVRIVVELRRRSSGLTVRR